MTCFFDGRAQTLLAWIPARGGSKGVPGKALRRLGGRPLIAYTIEAALAVEGIDRVVVTTDDERIREVATRCGAEAPFLRPPELARDDSSLSDVFLHLYRFFEERERFTPDIHIGMSPTHPLRCAGTLNRALSWLRRNPAIRNLRSVTRAEEEVGNLWREEDGRLVPWSVPADARAATSLYRNLFVFNIVVDSRGGEGNPSPYPFPVSPAEAIDIDEPVDLEIARLVMKSELWSHVDR